MNSIFFLKVHSLQTNTGFFPKTHFGPFSESEEINYSEGFLNFLLVQLNVLGMLQMAINTFSAPTGSIYSMQSKKVLQQNG